MIHLRGVPDDMIANNLFPSNLIHPGEMIKDELEAREISAESLAIQIDMPLKTIKDILNGNSSITTEFAYLLEAALGISAEFWIGLQTDYNKQKALTNPSFLERLAKIQKIASVF